MALRSRINVIIRLYAASLRPKRWAFIIGRWIRE